MRATYAGVTVSLPGSVLVLDADEARPVFHRPGYLYDQEAATACGHPATSRNYLPARHARRFARPCLRCFPQLRGQAELEVKAAPL